MRKRELAALLWLSSWCLVAVSVLWLFLMVPWVGLQCVIVVFPHHTHLLFPTSSILPNHFRGWGGAVKGSIVGFLDEVIFENFSVLACLALG